MPGITFEEPPGNRRAATLPHEEIAARLRENPGQWAVIDRRPSASSARNIAHLIKRASLKAYQPVGWYEAMSLSVDVRPACRRSDQGVPRLRQIRRGDEGR